MLKIIKYIYFMYLVSVAHGEADSKHDVNLRASHTVKKGLITDTDPLNASWNYLNNKMSQWLRNIKVMPILRTLRNFFAPEKKRGKVHLQNHKHSGNIFPVKNVNNKLDVWSFVRHFNKKGSYRLSQAYKDFSKILRIGRSSVIEIDIKYKFNAQIKKYIAELLSRRGKSNSQLDTQLIMFDVIENCYQIMLIEGANIWNKMSHQYRSHKKLPDPTTHKMLSEFVKGSLLHKIHDYDYLCNKTKLCRSFPGYFDYSGDILEEVKSMSDNKVHSLLLKTLSVLRSRHEKLSRVFGREIADRFNKVLQEITKMYIKDTRKLFVLSSGFIKHRRYWEPYMKSENIVVRVLMDMIDKPFAMTIDRRIRNGQFIHNELETEFSSLLTALDQSINGIDVEPALTHFVDYTLQNIDQSWDQYTKREAVTIMEVLLDGKTNSQETYRRLLSEGSHYVNSLNE